MNIGKAPASHGLKWLMQGIVLLRRNFFVWVLFDLLLWGMVFVASRIPVAGLLLALLMPVFLAGLMIGCRAVEKGEELEIGHFFAGFRTNALHLVALGGFYLICNVVIAGLMFAVGGGSIQQIVANQGRDIDPATLAQMLGPALAALFVGVTLTLPLTMAMWFSPLLVVFDNQKAAPALRHSFVACLRNTLPFLVYGLILLVPLVLLMAPFDLANIERNPGLWLVVLVTLPSIYTSYREIFQAPPPGAGQ